MPARTDGIISWPANTRPADAKSAQTHCLETKRPAMHNILRCTKTSASVLPGSRYERASLLTAHQVNHGVACHV